MVKLFISLLQTAITTKALSFLLLFLITVPLVTQFHIADCY